MLMALLRVPRQMSRQNRDRLAVGIGQLLHTSSPALFIEGNGPFEPTDQQQSSTMEEHVDFPEAPDPSTCCASGGFDSNICSTLNENVFLGCPNCVWVQYADRVLNYYSRKKPGDNSLTGEQQLDLVRNQINRHIADPNLRAYLWMELKAKKFE